MRPRLQDMPVAARLNLFILPILLAAMLLFGEVCILVYKRVVTGYVRQELQLYTESAAVYISSVLSDTLRLSNTVYSNPSLRRELQTLQSAETPMDIAQTMRIYSEVIDPLFANVSTPMKYVVRLYLLDHRLYADNSYVRYIEDLPPGLPVKDMLARRRPAVYWNVSEALVNGAPPAPLLCQSRVMYAYDGEPMALLNTEIYLDALESIVARRLTDKEGGGYRWTLQDGGTAMSRGEIQKDDIVATAQIAHGDSTLVVGYPAAIAIRAGVQQRKALIAAALCVVLIAFALIALVSRLALRRVMRVAAKFRDYGAQVTEPMRGRDEAAILDQTFTRVLTEYREDLERHYALQAEMRDLEARLLMSKINPHFLYNTLSAIRWSVLSEGNHEAAEVVDTLVAFYRNTLGKGRDIVMLQSEAEMLAQYVSLCTFTYSRAIDFEVDLPPDCATLTVPKFLLQPIVENAIRHGGSARNQRIRLEARLRDGTLLIDIDAPQDDMDADVMNHLNAVASGREPSREGYGIPNVAARIRALYGESYGLRFCPAPGGGTRARFSLPASTRTTNESRA